MELDPLYVDVAVTRWAAFTGKPAFLRTDAGDVPWDQVVAARAQSESKIEPVAEPECGTAVQGGAVEVVNGG